MRLALPLLAVAVGLVALPGARSDVVAAVAAARQSSPPAPGSTLTGTLLGSDGRAVSALLGFDLKDGAGRTIAASGCVQSPRCPVAGYGISRRVNASLGAAGSPDRGRWSTQWSVRVPPNTARVYVEAYPAGANTGTDESRYGHAYRRNVAVPYGQRMNLRLPLVCAAGGSTGWIEGSAQVDGQPTRLRRVTTWSQGPDNNLPRPVLGWNIGSSDPDGSYRLPNLPSGQTYQVIATAPDGRTTRVYGVAVSPCRGTTLPISF